MKISELVLKLQYVQQQHGDLDIEIEDRQCRGSDIEGVWLRRQQGTCGKARDWFVVGPK